MNRTVRPIEERVKMLGVQIMTPVDMRYAASMDDEALKRYFRHNAAQAVAELLVNDFDRYFDMNIEPVQDGDRYPEGVRLTARIRVLEKA